MEKKTNTKVKWMSDEFIAKTCKNSYNSFNEEFKNLIKEYQTLGKADLPSFMKKVMEIYPKLSENEKIIAALLEPKLASIDFESTESKNNFIDSYSKDIKNLKSTFDSIRNFDDLKEYEDILEDYDESKDSKLAEKLDEAKAKKEEAKKNNDDESKSNDDESKSNDDESKSNDDESKSNDESANSNK